MVSSPFAVPVSALDSLGESQAPSALGQSATPGSLAPELLSGPQNPVTAWRLVTATSDDFQVASGQSLLSVEVTAPRSAGLGSLTESAALHGGEDVSSIPEPVLTELEARLPGVQFRMPLQRGAQTVPLANGGVVSDTKGRPSPAHGLHPVGPSGP